MTPFPEDHSPQSPPPHYRSSNSLHPVLSTRGDLTIMDSIDSHFAAAHLPPLCHSCMPRISRSRHPSARADLPLKSFLLHHSQSPPSPLLQTRSRPASIPPGMEGLCVNPYTHPHPTPPNRHTWSNATLPPSFPCGSPAVPASLFVHLPLRTYPPGRIP